MNSSLFQFSPLQASGRFIPSVSGALILCSTHKLLPVRPLQLNNKAKIHPAAKTSGKEDEGKILISIKPFQSNGEEKEIFILTVKVVLIQFSVITEGDRWHQ